VSDGGRHRAPQDPEERVFFHGPDITPLGEGRGRELVSSALAEAGMVLLGRPPEGQWDATLPHEDS